MSERKKWVLAVLITIGLALWAWAGNTFDVVGDYSLYFFSGFAVVVLIFCFVVFVKIGIDLFTTDEDTHGGYY